MNTKHTPAPWSVTESKVYIPSEFIVRCTNGKMIARCYGDSTHSIIANAKLIAAAPELLEALKDLVWLIEQGASPEEIQESISGKAKPAMKKATL